MRGFLLAGLAIGLALPAQAAPVCNGPGVLERVAAMLQQAGRPMVLVAEPIGEESAGTGRLVRCAVNGRMLGYDTNHHGMQPIDALFVVRYSLELRQNGLFVRLD